LEFMCIPILLIESLNNLKALQRKIITKTRKVCNPEAYHHQLKSMDRGNSFNNLKSKIFMR